MIHRMRTTLACRGSVYTLLGVDPSLINAWDLH